VRGLAVRVFWMMMVACMLGVTARPGS
jgi:hypothetical protein